MPDPTIPPALTAEEWEGKSFALSTPTWEQGGLEVRFDNGLAIICDDSWYSTDPLPSEILGKVIASANTSLPDSDLRKITREWVKAVRDCATNADDEIPVTDSSVRRAGLLHDIADALESYLPPA